MIILLLGTPEPMRRIHRLLIVLILPAMLGVSCEKETTIPESETNLVYTKISAFSHITESITLSNGNRIFVGEDDGAAIIYVFGKDAQLLWNKRLDYPGRNVFNAVAEKDDGNIVVAGSTNSAFFETIDQSSDILMQCYSPSGEEIWTSVNGSENDEFILDLIIDSKGNCVATGSANSNFWRSFATKVSADGRFLWSREYSFNAFSEGRGIIEIDKGRYMIAGTEGDESLKWPYAAIINANGALQTELVFSLYKRWVDKDRDDYSIDILPTDQGYVFSMFYLPRLRDFPSLQLIEVTDQGSFISSKEFFGLGAFKPVAMRQDGTGYLICGASTPNLDYETFGFRETKSFVMRLNENFKVDWQTGVGSSELVQTAYDFKRTGNTISVGGFSFPQGGNSASFLHYWLDEFGKPIY